jgi:16S rRNA (adenine1518-N6/adenine1519-N6)-dimethyltransferase
LKIDFSTLTNKQIVIIANLPYNISTVLLVKWLKNIDQIKEMVLMFQKEVADRIVSTFNNKTYGQLSVITQVLCNVQKMFEISNKAFWPQPKVMSSVIKLIPFKNNNIDIEKLEQLLKICFQQRRKTIFNCLKKKIAPEKLLKTLNDSEIKKEDRPESISPSKFVNLSKELLLRI